MIIRQLCARHGKPTQFWLRAHADLVAGRAVIRKASRCQNACYATSIEPGDRGISPSYPPGPNEQTIPGYPDKPSSLLDAASSTHTARTGAINEQLQESQSSIDAAQFELNSYVSARTGGVTANPNALSSSDDSSSPSITAATAQALRAYRKQTKKAAKASHIGTTLVDTYNPNTLLTAPPTPENLTLPLLLANQTHLGHHTSLWHPGNSGYIFGIRESIHIISLDTTFAYLQRACKVIRNVAYRGGLVLFVGTRESFAPIVVAAAQRAKGYHIFDRWVPGTLSNGQQLLERCAVKIVDVNDNVVPTYEPLLRKQKHSVIRPDLVVVLNPHENEVALHECGLSTVPTIGMIDTDTNPAWVTYPIPANDDSLRSVGLIAGVLSQAARQGQEERLELARTSGTPTYNVKAVEAWLSRAAELDVLEISDSGSGRGEDHAKDKKGKGTVTADDD